MPKISDGKVGGLIEYLDSIVKNGRARLGVVTPLRTAVCKIFETVDGECYEDTDVRKVDINDYMIRFKNKALDKYNNASYKAYKNRASRAISWYENFLKDPGWTPTIVERSTKKNNENAAEFDKDIENAIQSKTVKQKINVLDDNKVERLVAFPFPISTGELATLHLPQKLSSSDAERIASFVKTLVIPDNKEAKM
ncbi:MAG: hypothetical protein LBM73_02870 [Candidatus Nomurabacteria bacterium]|jgi:hypothetical protein|nr:hypothetical protein [Candidatus Nomurabacteria bacterium]